VSEVLHAVSLSLVTHWQIILQQMALDRIPDCYQNHVLSLSIDAGADVVNISTEHLLQREKKRQTDE